MFLRIFLLLLVAFNKLSSSENCETKDWLQPFNNSSNFHCFSNGWYPDETDEDCRRYFVCVKNSENFLQLYLTCPNGTYFNEYTISCTEDYVCPYKLTTTTQKVTSNTDMSNSCLYESDSDYFDCHESGSFPNYNDLTCTSYFYCINIISPILTLKTKYFCSNNTYFNPETEVCEADYACPCDSPSISSENTDSTVLSTSAITEHSELTTETGTNTGGTRDSSSSDAETTTDEDISTKVDNITESAITRNTLTTQDITVITTESSNTEETKVTTEESAFTNGESTTEKRTTEEDLSTKEDDTSEAAAITSTYSTTTIDECSYNSNPNYFTCNVKGRFRNANDMTCQTYFLCSILSSGRVIQTKYTCPTNSNFNPKLELCDADYVCPCTTSEVTSKTEEVTTQDVTVITTEDSNTEETKVTTEKSTTMNEESTTEKRTTEEDLSTKEDDASESATTTSTYSTTTIDECSYNSNPNYFTCTVKGRFRNANDRTCQTYFLCSILSSGRVIQTKYTCPTNSKFNPKLELCDADYECPCTTSEVTSTTEEVTTQDVTVITTEKHTTEEDLSTTEDDTSESATTTSTSTTAIDECSYNSNPNYFTCTVKGRFRNANDRTCQTYFLCSILSSGRVIQTKYTCPTNSNFNPKLELCDADYVCPCTTSEVTSKTEEVTTQDVTVITTEDSNTEETKVTTEKSTTMNEESTTEKRTTEEDLSTKEDDASESATTTSTYSTTTIDECSYNSNPNYFTCTVKGRFRNANDRTCQTYFLCSILSSGRVIQTKYTCPTNSKFNPKLELCDADYECPCTTSEVTSTTEEVTTQDVTVITTEKHTTEEDLSTTEDDTSESATTTSTSTTAIDECSYNSNPNYFTCTVKGRFRNANDRTCQTYFLCSILSSGRVIQTKYTCPTYSYFNPKLELCDADYECPCTTSEVTSTTEEVTTQDVTVITTEGSNTEETKVTTEESAFTNGESTTEKRTTEEDDTSESATTTSTYSTTTIDECSYNSNPNYFRCTVKGRFKNANDRTCQTYFLCSILSSGRVIQTKYTCPSNSNFNPKLELCDADYECPCTTSEVTSTTEELTTQDVTVITTEKHTTEEDLSTTEDDTSESATTTSTSTTAIDECSYNSNPNYFTCTVKGRFRNANDRTCQTYFLCNILSSGRVIQTKYACPTNSNFNPKLQLCDVDYKCPCTTSTATSTTQEVTA